MAVPMRRTSRSNTRTRRARWKAQPVDLVTVTIAGRRYQVPRRLKILEDLVQSVEHVVAVEMGRVNCLRSFVLYSILRPHALGQDEATDECENPMRFERNLLTILQAT